MNVKALSAAIGLACAAGLLGPLSTAAQASFPGDAGPLILGNMLVQPDGSAKRPMPAVVKSHATFSPDGATVAFVESFTTPTGGPRSIIKILEPDGDVQTVATDKVGITELSWSPDGDEIAANVFYSYGMDPATAIKVYPLSGFTPRLLVKETGSRPVVDVDWNPKSDDIAYLRAGYDVFTVPASGGTPTNRTENCTYPGDEGVQCDHWTTGEPGIGAQSMEWSPDGTRLVLAEYDEITILTLGGNHGTFFRKVVTVQGGWPVQSLAWSPDGSRIAMVNQDTSGNRFVELVKLDGTRIAKVDGIEQVVDWQPCDNGVCPAIGTRPAAPSIGAASSGTLGRPYNATARWDAPPDTSGTPVTGYRVQAQKLSGSGTVQRVFNFTRVPEARRLTMKLPIGRYKFRVAALNVKGQGPWSANSNIVRSQ